jgi:archaellin
MNLIPDEHKKAVMGVGMLLLFVSTILVSAVAAGVLIQATNLMEQSATQVARDARDRLTTAVQVSTVYAYGNTTTSEIYGFEYYMGLRAGSPAIQLRDMGHNFVSGETSYSAELNESLIGEDCTFDNLTSQQEYCYEILTGNNDTILETGELVAVHYNVGNRSARLGPEEDFQATFQVGATGSVNTIEATIPNLILNSKIRLR